MQNQNPIATSQRQAADKRLMRLMSASLLLLAFTFLFPLNVLAGGAQPPTNLNVTSMTTGIGNVYALMQGFAAPVCILVFVLCGLALMGGQQGRQWAKPTMLFSTIGLGITMLAPKIIESFKTSFTVT